MDVFTRSLDGITHEIINAPEGYTIKVSSTTPTITYADVYKQEVTIEIDGYNGSGAMETEVLLKDKADPLKQIKITVYSEGYQGGILFSDASSTNVTGWNEGAYSFDATARATIITLTVLTQSMFGATYKVADAPAGYTPQVTLGPILMNTYAAGAYKQQLMITVPEYTGTAAMKIGVVVKDNADKSKTRTVTILSDGYTGGVSFANASSTNSAGWTADTYRYDATAKATTITMDVITPSSQGAIHEVTGAPDRYTLTVSWGTVSALSDGTYKQNLKITVPEYTDIAAMETKVIVKDKALKSKTKTVAIFSVGYAGEVSFVNASSTNSAGWTADTYRYDATARATTLKMDVITLSSQGAIHEVTGAPEGYEIAATLSTPATAVGDGTYKQTLTITVPEYMADGAMETKIVIKDKALPAKTKAVTLYSSGYAGDVSFANASSTNSAGWTAATYRYDARGAATTITIDVITPSSQGAVYEITGAPAGYNVAATLVGSIASVAGDGTYKQNLKITVPQYTGKAAMETKVVVKDKAQPSKTKTVIIFSEEVTHSGWAGCNIYYDEAKGHLTFDDVGVTTHEKYQGVYFQWGSLWGISPKGKWSGATDLYPPAGGTVAASAAPVSYAWKNIPRIPDGKLIPALGESERDWAYAYQATDGGAGIGDICKYLTDKGWAPGSPSKKWRMPTSNEFEAKADYVSGGSFGNQTSNMEDGTFEINGGYRKGTNPTDPFFPASGYRDCSAGLTYFVDIYGDYWSSSPYDDETNSYNLGFSSGTMYPAYKDYRTYGFVVRCVAE